MKLTFRAIVIIMVAFLLMGTITIPIAAADTNQAGDVRYTQKIVSVLYDNSGSMSSSNKNDYALYALQMLMALLDDSDILVITPMNSNLGTVTSTSSGIEVNLSASDRNAELTNALTSSSSFLSKTPSGGTPGSAIKVAVKQLEERGLKDRDNLATAAENKEYWLVVLTDGVFNEQTDTYGADAVIESHITDFPSLRTIYLGLGGDSPDLSNSDLTKKLSFTPYRAATTDDIVSAMQSVANQLSGRYTLESKYYTVNGSTVTVDLNRCEVSFKNISVIAQDCGVKLVSAKHDGKNMNIAQPCVIVPKGLTNKIKNGYSGVITGDPYLAGGTLILEFSGAVSADKLNILAEPALIIESYIEYKNGANWERTTMQYVNANLSKNDKIRVGYEVYEQSGVKIVDLNKLFGSCEASVTYAGNCYNVGEEIPLVVGNNEIGVLVSVMDGAYTMYSSIICIIEENPTYYRVEVKGDDAFSPSRKAQVVFTVYSDNMPLSATMLSNYQWKLTATAPNNANVNCSASVGADGKITADLSAISSVFGDYQLDFTITSKYGISRNITHTVNYNPSVVDIKGEHIDSFQKGETTTESKYAIFVDGIQLTAEELENYTWELKTIAPGGGEADVTTEVDKDGTIKSLLDVKETGYGYYETKIMIVVSETMMKEYSHIIKNYPSMITVNALDDGLSLSQHQLTINQNSMRFELFSDGQPFVFDNGITSYRVLVDGTDVTQYAIPEGNILNYTPHADHFGGTLPLGEKTVTLKVECSESPLLNTSVSTKMIVVSDKYEVVPIDHERKTVNRFDLRHIDAVLYFKVIRDGELISADELSAALENGEINVTDEKGTFTWQFWLPCGKDVTVDIVNEEPVLAYHVTKDWIKPFDHYMAMFIFNGDKPVTVEYRGATGADAIFFQKSNAWSYIWRILVILFVIYCILYIIGFFNGRCRSLPSGTFVAKSIGDNGDECSFRGSKGVNLSFWDKYSWHIARFIPHRKTLWYHQDSIRLGKGVFGYDEYGNLGFRFNKSVKMYRVNFDDTGSKAADQFKEFKKALAQYDGKGALPSLKGEKPTYEQIRSILKVDSSSGQISASDTTNYQYYGMIDSEDGSLKYVMFFIYKS